MRQSRVVTIICYAVVLLVIIWSLLPIYWMLITAFKPWLEIKTNPPTYWPSQWVLTSFVEALGKEYHVGPSILHSVIITLGTFALSMAVGIPAGWSIARFKTGGDNLSFSILSVRFMPPIVPVIAFYVIAGHLRILDTYGLLILVDSVAAIPFVVWISMGFFEEIPREIEEAAQVDGASWFQLFWYHVLPLAAPGLVAVALFVIIFTWNEYLYGIMLTANRTAPFTRVIPYITKDHSQPDWGAVCAMGLLVTIPITLTAWYLQKYIVRGLTYGAVRE
jgi:multiple sugar transport system permease protein